MCTTLRLVTSRQFILGLSAEGQQGPSCTKYILTVLPCTIALQKSMHCIALSNKIPHELSSSSYCTTMEKALLSCLPWECLESADWHMKWGEGGDPATLIWNQLQLKSMCNTPYIPSSEKITTITIFSPFERLNPIPSMWVFFHPAWFLWKLLIFMVLERLFRLN